ncbi:biotin--[acetyl-CoA-carboxylase] ligase [Paracrocinitomix mangrovi]|nr:biotin--[acetyl-CoA-carboxylase] ligase [Paracrocinitomix mangrovi]
MFKTTKVASGTVVIAKNQHGGRGQRSNVWTAEAGKNLTCSIIFFPSIKIDKAFYLNIAVSLAVRKTLEDLSIQAKIKWPNDILVNDKKICGILIENQLAGQMVNTSVIGIGLNINQLDFAEGINATSIQLEKKQKVEVMDVFDHLYGYLDFYLNLLMEQNWSLLKKHYYQFLYLLDAEAKFEDANGIFNGKIVGISENGLLLIQTASEKREYDIQELKYVY